MVAHLEWQRTEVLGRPASYVRAGDGPPVVLLHGWGLSHHTYRKVLQSLADRGFEVWAPALPGFAGTPDLPDEEFSLAGYGRWVAAFLEGLDTDAPVTLIGHSFGGGVAIQTAHDRADLVSRLVCVNSIGGSTWTADRGVVRSLAQRPLWDWGLHLQADLWPWRQATRVLPVILEDALPNLLRNPRGLWRAGHLARTADLRSELEMLRRRRLPVIILGGRDDNVLPAASLDSLCRALGDAEVVTVPGNHSWLLSDPRAFGEVMTNVLNVARPDADVAA